MAAVAAVAVLVVEVVDGVSNWEQVDKPWASYSSNPVSM
jgi:hypothetical protein